MNPHPCPACSHPGMEPFYEVASVPTNSCILLESPSEARASPTGDIRLGLCSRCGFISNMAFEPELTEYSGRYEATQGFSGTFSAFEKGLASRLVKTFGLEGKEVLEIGCGQGEFLHLLSEIGGMRGLGFDPAYRPERDAVADDPLVRVESSFFTEADASVAADLICCKMTLEHIHEPGPLLRSVARAASNRSGTVVFFQVPNATRILTECSFEDIYYEHCSYYGPDALSRLFRRFEFEILALESVFDGQYLVIEARHDRSRAEAERALPTGMSVGDLGSWLDSARSFEVRCEEATGAWEGRLDTYRNGGRDAVLWGSGSKAVSFLTTLEGTESITHVVDINPYRHGHFMPGTGQPIISPDELAEVDPDVVVVMNRAYVGEITDDLLRRGLRPEVVAL